MINSRVIRVIYVLYHYSVEPTNKGRNILASLGRTNEPRKSASAITYIFIALYGSGRRQATARTTVHELSPLGSVARRCMYQLTACVVWRIASVTRSRLISLDAVLNRAAAAAIAIAMNFPIFRVNCADFDENVQWWDYNIEIYRNLYSP